MKWVGIAFIVASAGTMGIQTALSLRKKGSILQQLLRALEVLQNEIGFCGTALPQAFALMAVSAHGGIADLFSQVARSMDKHRWQSPSAAMEQSLKQQTEMPSEAARILKELSSSLGQYDAEAQLRAIERARMETERAITAVELERSKKGKSYEALGICAGLALAILLI